MNIQQLEYIVALDEQRHFVRAAEVCFITQPTLTMQIRKLEEELAVTIFDRDKQPVEPTPVGASLIAQARVILQGLQTLRETATGEVKTLKGDFKLGIIPTVAPYLLPLFIQNFLHKYPDVVLQIEELQTVQVIERLRNGTLDLAIVATPLEENGLREMPLYNEPFLVYLPTGHALLDKKKLQVADLQADKLLLLSDGHCFRNQVLQVCHAQGQHSVLKNLRYQSGSLEALTRMADSGLGYTLLPELSVFDHNQHVRRFADPQPTREISIVVSNAFSKQILLDKMREEILLALPETMAAHKHIVKIKLK